MKSNAKNKAGAYHSDKDNKANDKKKGNPFWKNKKKERQEDDDNFEEVKIGAPSTLQRPDDESSGRY